LTLLSNVVAYVGRSDKRERPMPLTEINVTTPPPVYSNYWREREAARAAEPPPPAIDPGLLEDGRPGLPAFPLQVFPRLWREWVSDAAHWAGSPEDYVAQALLAAVAGLCSAVGVHGLIDIRLSECSPWVAAAPRET
jgi:hypothetical protein